MSVKRHPALVVAHYGTLILLAVVCVAPIILMFATSLKLQTQIFNTGMYSISLQPSPLKSPSLSL